MKKKIFIYLTVVGIMASCHAQKKIDLKMEKENQFEWQPGTSAPKEYPMETYHISFIDADSTGGGMMSDIAQIGWGIETGGGGRGIHPLPVRLDVSWLSYTEDQFWQGSFILPYDTMLRWFKKGWMSISGITNKPYFETYSKIIVGMAPGGVVVVWLGSYNHRQVEIARFLATKVNVDYDDFVVSGGGIRNPEKWEQHSEVKQQMETERFAYAKDYVKKHGITYGLWDTYRERFNLQPVVKYNQLNKSQTTGIIMHFYNGEEEFLLSEGMRDEKIDFAKRARIKFLEVQWEDDWAGKKHNYYMQVDMNEEEIFKAYKQAYGTNPNQEGELVIEISPGNDVYKIFLQTKDNKIELIQTKGEVYLKSN